MAAFPSYDTDLTPTGGSYTYMEALEICAEDNLNPTMSPRRQWVNARTGRPVYLGTSALPKRFNKKTDVKLTRRERRKLQRNER
jgi:hypothetical protein